MPIDEATSIQAWAAVASVVVAFISAGVAVAAVVIAVRAKRIGEQSVAVARRQLALAAVPLLIVDRPQSMNIDAQGRLKLRVRVAGDVPAISVHGTIWAATKRYQPLATTIRRTGRQAHFAPGQEHSLFLPIESLREGSRWLYPFYVIAVDYYGPHGAYVRQWYDWDTGVKWRLRHMWIDPGEGEPIKLRMGLGAPSVVDWGPKEVGPPVSSQADAGRPEA